MTPEMQSVLSRLEKVKFHPGSDPYWTAKCPAHDDGHPSLSVRSGADGRVLVKCHANKGCTFQKIAQALGLEPAAFYSGGEKSERKVVKSYVYRDEAGTPLYQIVRFEPKSFGCRRYEVDPEAPWKTRLTWGLGSTRTVLYGLPEIVQSAAADVPVIVVEGEKDARALQKKGLVATCNPFGAGKWQASYSESLTNRKVLIVPDADQAGEDHAEEVYHSLMKFTAEVLMAPIPPAYRNMGVKDVSDLLWRCDLDQKELMNMIVAWGVMQAEEIIGQLHSAVMAFSSTG